MASNRRQEFRVEIDGIQLSGEVLERINGAVRKAVLHELASVNLQGSSIDLLAGEGLTVSAIQGGGGGGGGTQGIRVRPTEAV